MGKIMDSDEAEDLRNWQCRDGNDLSDDQLNGLCDSHEALRDLLRRVMDCNAWVGGGDSEWRRIGGELPSALRAEVEAAVEGGK